MWITIRKSELENNKFSMGMPLTRFIRRFYCDKQIRRAELKISALGIFRVEINGKEIDEYFMPGYTNYNKYVPLCSYDITYVLAKENRIADAKRDEALAELGIAVLRYTNEIVNEQFAFVCGDILQHLGLDFSDIRK